MRLAAPPPGLKAGGLVVGAGYSVSAGVLEETLDEAIEKMRGIPTLVRVEPPALVVGDLHGDIEALFDALEAGVSECGECRSLVLVGDYVDRGPYGAEVLQAVASLFLSNPSSVVLLRGNHETLTVSMKYGYAAELMKKYGKAWEVLYAKSLALFSHLPYAALIGDKVLVLHGGLPNGLDTVEGFKMLAKGLVDVNPKKNPVEYQILWNDPAEGVYGFRPSGRGDGAYVFGPDVTLRFTSRNGVRLIIRGHTPQPHGFAFYHGGRILNVFTCRYYGYPISIALVTRDEARPILLG